MFSFFTSQPLGRIGQGEGFGPFAAFGSFAKATELLEKILSKTVGFLTIVGGLYFIFQFIIGSYGWMTAGGNKESLKQAQDRISHAVVGLLILVAAYALISVIGSILGLEILNPAKILETIK